MGGNYVLIAQTGLMLAKVMFHRIKTISSLDKRTLYNNLLERYGRSADYPRKPFTIPVPFFCDYLPFCMSIGVLAADFSYFYDDENNNFLLYPVYHTPDRLLLLDKINIG